MEFSNRQRAVWSVLIPLLVTPVLGAVAGVVIALAGQAAGMSLPIFEGMPIGVVAVQTFIWAILPTAVAALGLVPYVIQGGTYSWLHAAVAGVIGFAGAVFIEPFNASGLLPVLAFVAGLVFIATRQILVAIGILNS